jgi:hypothetical protein
VCKSNERLPFHNWHSFAGANSWLNRVTIFVNVGSAEEAKPNGQSQTALALSRQPLEMIPVSRKVPYMPTDASMLAGGLLTISGDVPMWGQIC